MGRLIESPSISSAENTIDQSNFGVINLLAEWLETLKFNVRIIPVSPGKANLIATLGESDKHTGLVLSGHTDTVPFDDGRWTVDPFKLTEKNQRLYGLGSVDMKSFFAVALEAVQAFESEKFKRPLVIVATADEESSMSGAKLLLEQGIRLGKYAVIGEPTRLKPVRMHKGVMMESIVVTGKSGHSSNPALGANALEGMHTVISELLRWRLDLQQSNQNEFFEVAVPTMNLGSIRGGDNPNRICAHCETQIDIRPLPGMNIVELREILAHRLESVLESNPLLSLNIKPLFEGVPAFETPPGSDFVKACEKFAGHNAEAVAFATEAPYLSQLGMQTVVMGPGAIDQAHQPDEYLSLDQVNPAIALYKSLIHQFCIVDD